MRLDRRSAANVLAGAALAPIAGAARAQTHDGLIADFYFSDEVQGIYANTGHGVVIRDLKTGIAPDMKPFADVKPLIAEDSTRIEQYLALAREIYK